MAKKSSGFVIPMSQKEESAGKTNKRVPEGDYKAKVISLEHATSQAGNSMLVWEFELVDGKHKGSVYKDRTVLTANALWKVEDLLTALGIDVPQTDFKLPPKKVVGKELGLTLTDDEYENSKGKTVKNSTVSDYISIDELGGADEDDDDEDEDEDDEDTDVDSDDDDDDDDLDEVDLDEV